MLALSLVLVFGSHETRVDWRGSGRAFATWGALAVSATALKLAGFVVSFAALTVFMVAVMYRRTWLTALVVGLSVAAAFYVVFPLALGVALP
jgi:hypothetical protein